MRERNSNPPKTCTIENCENKHLAKGFCRKHYLKNYHHRDPLHQEREMHGLHKTPEYKVWRWMKSRCKDKKNKTYYGKGIIVCSEWEHSFLTFLKDMGKKPSPEYEIDRKNANKNYCKENCRWLKRIDNNRRRDFVKLDLEKAGEIKKLYSTGNYTHPQLAEKFNVCRTSITSILNNKTWKEA